MFRRFLMLIQLVVIVLFLSSCASKQTIEITAFSLFSSDYVNPGKFYIYLDYVNHFKDYTVEQAELTIESTSDQAGEEAQHMIFRFFETEGVAYGQHNKDHIRQPELLKMDVTYTAYISKLYFSDGSIWENTRKTGKKQAALWRKTENEQSPVRLCEANFYKQNETSTILEYNVDWINESEDAIQTIVFEIIPKTADGTVCKDAEGNDAVIYSTVFQNNPVLPSESNQDYHHKIYSSDLKYTVIPTIYEIHPIRVLSDSGKIWDTSSSKSVRCVFLGQKGYDFAEKTNLKSVNKLIRDINQEFRKYGIDEGNPEIYIRDHEYIILRYRNADICAQLNENNEVKNDSASFSCYYRLADYENPDQKDAITEAIENHYRAVFCAILKEAPYEQISKAVDSWINGETAHLELDSQTLNVIEDGGLIYSQDGEKLLNIIAASGSKLNYDPVIRLLWAKDSIY